MHIKQIIISGFRSFRNQEEIEQFSSHHNVIVGRNGSGKSNFFNAIQFALLSPKFLNLKQEDRQSLLYEGAGANVLAAYVEIIFDNSDGRFSVDTEEVIIRRTIGQKKDEFFLNRKRIQKNEIISLLESAGFSKSNPYYIVQQGKVATLCIMKDSDRLGLLKEIAGTIVYEERKTESLKILAETSNKQAHIEEVLSFIEERLGLPLTVYDSCCQGELEREKEELILYDQLDRQRRALYYTIYSLELTKTTEHLESMEITRHDQLLKQQQLYQKLGELQDSLAVDESQQIVLSQELDTLLTNRQSKLAEIANLVQRKTVLLMQREEHFKHDQEIVATTSRLKEELSELNEGIQTREHELFLLEPDYQSTTKLLAERQSELLAINNRIEVLYGRQGRGRQFKSISERNSFLERQIDELRRQVSKSSSLILRLRDEASHQEDRLRHEFHQINLAKAENESQRKKVHDLDSTLKDLISQRNEQQELRKAGWKKNDKIQEDLRNCESNMEKYKQLLNSSLPRYVSVGLAAVERIVDEIGMSRDIHSKNPRGVYFGPVIDNITLNGDGFRAAVEVAAGNGLFHVIVDSDRTAALLIKELERRKGGRLTFLPLNQLRVQEVLYPSSTDVRPLLEVAISYERVVKDAVQQIFGKKLLAKDLDIGAKYSREFSLDVVTRDGDLINRKGGFEGGYRDERVSRMYNVSKIRELTATKHRLQGAQHDLEEENGVIEANMNSILRELQRIEAERNHLRETVTNTSTELSQRSRQHEMGMDNLAKRQNVISSMQSELQVYENQIREYESEMSSEMKKDMSESERREIQQKSEEARNIQNEIEKLDARLISLNDKRKSYQADLRDNLGRRKDELKLKLAEFEDPKIEEEESKGRSTRKKKVVSKRDEKKSKHLEVIELDLQSVEHALDDLNRQVNNIDTRVQSLKIEISRKETTMDALKTDENRLEESVAEGLKLQDSLLNKRNLLYESVEQKRTLIRELGSLPRKELEDYSEYSEPRLLATLKEVNDQLKSFSGVNRKALDQYINFNQQRQQFVERYDSLSHDKMKIQELMDGLDLQKEEAIWRTFQGVSKHFTDVFQELVPYGRGSLIMIKAADTQNESGVEEFIREEKVSQSGYHGPSIDEFLGVRVKVSFSDTVQQFEMHQLSGGQKALVALALIFAIQRCDPAPFYLFDEIDQALDANHRLAVARLIQKQASSKENPTQFITSTFRSELVAVANKCYGLTLEKKSSQIYPLSKQDAQLFVQNLLTEEEGQVMESSSYE